MSLRYLILTGIVGLTALCGFLFSELEYQATTSLFVEQERTESSDGDDAVAQQIATIKSDGLAKKISTSLKLEQNAAVQRSMMSNGGASSSSLIGSQKVETWSVHERIVEWLGQRLEVSRDNQSGLILIKFTAPNPALAVDVPNAIASTLVERLDSMKQGGEQARLKELEANLNEQRSKSVKAESAVASALEENGGADKQQRLVELRQEAEKQRTLLSVAMEEFKAAKELQDSNGPAVSVHVVELAKSPADIVYSPTIIFSGLIFVLSLIFGLWFGFKYWRSRQQGPQFGSELEEKQVLGQLGSPALSNPPQQHSMRVAPAQMTPNSPAPQHAMMSAPPLAPELPIVSNPSPQVSPVDAVVANPVSPESSIPPMHSSLSDELVTLERPPAVPIIEPVPSASSTTPDRPSQMSGERADRPNQSGKKAMRIPVPGEADLMMIAKSLTMLETARVVVLTASNDENPGGAVALARLMASVGPTVLLDMAGDTFASENMLRNTNLPGMKDLLARSVGFAGAIHSDLISDAHIVPFGRETTQLTPQSIGLVRAVIDKLENAYKFVIIDSGSPGIKALARMADKRTGIIINQSFATDISTIARHSNEIAKSGFAEPIIMSITPRDANAVGVAV